MRNIAYFTIGLLFISACKDLTNTDPEQTDSFIRYYGDFGNTTGNDIKQLTNGDLLLLGVNEDQTLQTFLIKTDAFGNIQSGWPKSYTGFRGMSLEVDDNGYYIIGDRINPATDSSSMMLLITSTSGDSISSITVNSSNIVGASQNVNFHGTALDVTGNMTALGYTRGGTVTSLYRVGFDLTDNSIAWTQFLADGPIYLPGKSLLPNGSGHHWTTTRTIGNETRVLVQVGQEDQPHGNSDEIDGEEVRQLTSISGGFAGIGTRNGNVLVFITDNAGNILGDSEMEAGSGKSVYQGADGAVIALSTTISDKQGQTDNDFIISKINADGSTVIFSTRVGGSGNEEDGTIIESSNGGYLILGTTQFDGLQSMVLIKTNKNGTLKL